MIEIIYWAAAALALVAAFGMLFLPAKPDAKRRTRLLGLVFLGVAAFNVFMVTRS